MNAQSKHISQIALPSIDPQATDSTDNGTGTNLGYLTELKAKTDKLAKNWKGEFGIKKSYLARHKIVQEAKQELGDNTLPTKKELNYCFPECDHPEPRQESPDRQSVAKSKSKNNSPIRPQQSEKRLKNAGNPNLTDKDWEQIEKMNGKLHVGMHYAAGFTPEFLALDIELKLTSDFGRLYQYITLDCNKEKKDKETDETDLNAKSKSVTVKKLANKLETTVPQMWRTVKKMHASPVATANPLPKKADDTFIFDLHYVTEMNELVVDKKRIEAETGMKVRDLWENRELLGFSLYRSGGETEGEAEGEGVSPPSS